MQKISKIFKVAEDRVGQMLTPSMILEKKIVPGSVITPTEDLEVPGYPDRMLFRSGVGYKIKQFYVNRAGQGSILVESEVGDWGIHFAAEGGAEFFRLPSPGEQLSQPSPSPLVKAPAKETETPSPIAKEIEQALGYSLSGIKLRLYNRIFVAIRASEHEGSIGGIAAVRRKFLGNGLNENQMTAESRQFEAALTEMSQEGLIQKSAVNVAITQLGDKLITIMNNFLISQKK